MNDIEFGIFAVALYHNLRKRLPVSWYVSQTNVYLEFTNYIYGPNPNRALLAVVKINPNSKHIFLHLAAADSTQKNKIITILESNTEKHPIKFF